MPEFTSASVLIDDVDRVRTITLNRPEKLNAFDGPMEDAVIDALHEGERTESVGALVITGAGRGFCSGHDFSEVALGSGSGRGPGADASGQNRIAQAILRLDKPVLGAINGVVAGGGFAIALSCDMRIASSAATFQELHVHRGIVPALESWLLPRVVGLGRALELMATGRRLTADEAVAWGLVTSVEEPDALMERAAELAGALAKLPPTAFGFAKRATYLGLQSSMDDTLQYIAAARTIGGLAGESGRGAREFLEAQS